MAAMSVASRCVARTARPRTIASGNMIASASDNGSNCSRFSFRTMNT